MVGYFFSFLLSFPELNTVIYMEEEEHIYIVSLSTPSVIFYGLTIVFILRFISPLLKQGL